MSANDERKGLLLFRSHWDVIGELPPEEFKRVMQAIFASAGANCEMPEDMSLYTPLPEGQEAPNSEG